MKLIPCTPEHIHQIEMPPTVDMSMLRSVMGESQRPILAEWARTLEDEGEILAIFGITPRWRGVCEAWAFITDHARQAYPLAVVRAARRCIATAEEKGMHRIQAAVEVNFGAGHKFLIKRGFEAEGLMRRFGVNAEGDYILYARIH
jgi:RimJ/RimL family protein N-acetyltransferase